VGAPEQYVRWLRHFVTGNWGRSIKGSRPVWPELKRALANTIVLGVFATVIGIGVGLIIGIIASLRQYSKFDTMATTGAFVGISIPPFVSAILIQMFVAVNLTGWLHLKHPLLPTSGVYPPGHHGFDPVLRLKYMVLPAFVVAIQVFAEYSRYMRASLLEVVNSEYMRTARAKGISERQVIVRHALRNALIPVVTITAINVGAIVTGLIVTEKIFEYPGMGLFLINALNNGDYPQLMPWLVIVVLSTLTFNLLADVAYAWLDPRIRLD
jgi:peptide/nickel transport system permease protein